MNALIPDRIVQSNMELIRDQIGAILALELANQKKFGDSDLSTIQVWNSRFVPFDKTEMPSVNVNFLTGDLIDGDASQSTFMYQYTIDVHASAKTTEGDRGDKLSVARMNKILMICKYILDSNEYGTLGFPAQAKAIIGTVYVGQINIANPMGMDADSLVMGRLVFNVKAIESEILSSNWAMIKGLDTQVKLDLTNKGYKYIVNLY